jgi:hypothetical protein
MNFLISAVILFSSASSFAQNSLTTNQTQTFRQFLGVEAKNCAPLGAGCRTFSDCCRGYCDGTHRCNDGGGYGECTPDGLQCATPQECCSNNCDTTGLCR